tara:strand:+ start:8669 stop:9004 length:336 start_codon:yes stop_codon:yes gene_type:complete
MIIRYERTVEYEIDIPPNLLLRYAKKYIEFEETVFVSLEDIIEDISEDTVVILDDPLDKNTVYLGEEQIDYSVPINACFPRLHEDDDPFCGVGITIEELEKNLKQFNEEED